MRLPKKPKPLKRRELEKALLKLFLEDEPVIPRCVMSNRAYDVAWHLWSQTKAGRKELRAMGYDL